MGGSARQEHYTTSQRVGQRSGIFNVLELTNVSQTSPQSFNAGDANGRFAIAQSHPNGVQKLRYKHVEQRRRIQSQLCDDAIKNDLD